MRRFLVMAAMVTATAAGLVLLPAAAAQAHPLGNFTVNTYSGLQVSPRGVTVDLVVDMAEIPAYQERQSTVDTNADGRVSAAEQAAYGDTACARLARQATLTVAGAVVPLAVRHAEVAFPPGQAGLDTLRLTCTLDGSVRIDRPEHVRYQTTAYTDRIGWREIVAVGDRTTLTAADVPATSRSARLTAYPADLLSSPLDVRAADLDLRPGGPPAAAASSPSPATATPRGVDGPTRAFTDLISRQNLTVPFGLLAVLLALGLGALHAFAPGHGKTVMAAFLLGRRGGLRQAATIGLTVTATHTAGVMVLGLALVASVHLAPQTLYPWLGLISGLLLVTVGLTLLRRPQHSHHHHHSHDHHHDHEHPHDHKPGPGKPRLLVMGIAGGLLPSPSALVVLLGAIALGRTWFGVLLVLAYGLGMAGCLIGVGALLARGARLLRHGQRNRAIRVATTLLPIATAVAIVLVGTGLALRAGATLLGA